MQISNTNMTTVDVWYYSNYSIPYASIFPYFYTFFNSYVLYFIEKGFLWQ